MPRKTSAKRVPGTLTLLYKEIKDIIATHSTYFSTIPWDFIKQTILLNFDGRCSLCGLLKSKTDIALYSGWIKYYWTCNMYGLRLLCVKCCNFGFNLKPHSIIEPGLEAAIQKAYMCQVTPTKVAMAIKKRINALNRKRRKNSEEEITVPLFITKCLEGHVSMEH